MPQGPACLPLQKPNTTRLMHPITSSTNPTRPSQPVPRIHDPPPINRITAQGLKHVLQKHLRGLQTDVRSGRYRHQALRRAWIPKPGKDEKRPVGIPTIRDRVAQQAVLRVIEPLYEGSFSESSFGFRRGGNQHQAVEHALKHIRQGHTWVVDVDLKSFLGPHPHHPKSSPYDVSI
jgi:RNA-directed DNA polymerase